MEIFIIVGGRLLYIVLVCLLLLLLCVVALLCFVFVRLSAVAFAQRFCFKVPVESQMVATSLASRFRKRE